MILGERFWEKGLFDDEIFAVFFSSIAKLFFEHMILVQLFGEVVMGKL